MPIMTRARSRAASKRAPRIEIDPVALRLLGSVDVLRIVLGWIWSIHGIWVTAICVVGVWAGIREIELGLNNTPISATADTLPGIHDGRVVTVTGEAEASERLEFESSVLKKQFTITMLAGTHGSVMAYERGLKSNQEKSAIGPRDYTGRLYVIGRSDDKIDNNHVSLLSKLDAARIQHADPVYVIADGVIPIFAWWYAVVTGAFLAGSIWIIRRVILAARCISDRDLLYAFLTERVGADPAKRDSRDRDDNDSDNDHR